MKAEVLSPVYIRILRPHGPGPGAKGLIRLKDQRAKTRGQGPRQGPGPRPKGKAQGSRRRLRAKAQFLTHPVPRTLVENKIKYKIPQF